MDGQCGQSEKRHPAEDSEITLNVRIAFPAEQQARGTYTFRCFPVKLGTLGRCNGRASRLWSFAPRTLGGLVSEWSNTLNKYCDEHWQYPTFIRDVFSLKPTIWCLACFRISRYRIYGTITIDGSIPSFPGPSIMKNAAFAIRKLSESVYYIMEKGRGTFLPQLHHTATLPSAALLTSQGCLLHHLTWRTPRPSMTWCPRKIFRGTIRGSVIRSL